MSFYDLKFKDTKGNIINMREYKDKVILIVNTATKCGFAPQFEGLENLNKKYKEKGLIVIGFPCNQFMNQEPETNDSVVETCKLNFGVTFLLSEKIKVNGKDTHPIYKYLKKELPTGILGKKIKWNFTKFLIDSNGKPYKRYSPKTKPKDIEHDIVGLLEK